jgi:hypothetical protein
MQVLKTLAFTKSAAAAAIAFAAMAAPAISHASPDDGMACRVANGYGAQFAGGNLKCVKTVVRNISGAFQCLNPSFPGINGTRQPVIRVAVAGDATGGKDLCPRPGVVMTSNSSLTGLTLGQDFQFATVNQARIAATREAIERSEQTAMGLGLDGVDSRSTSTVVVNGGIGAEDIVRGTFTMFTFAIPAPSLQLSPLQRDPLPLNLPTLGL